MHPAFYRYLHRAVRWPFESRPRQIGLAYVIVAIEILAICDFNGTTAVGVLSSVDLGSLLVTVPGTTFFPWIGGVLLLIWTFSVVANMRQPDAASGQDGLAPRWRILLQASFCALCLLYAAFAPLTFSIPLVCIGIIALLERPFYKLRRTADPPSIVGFYRALWSSPETVEARLQTEQTHLKHHRAHRWLSMISLLLVAAGVGTTMRIPRPWVAAESLLLCDVPSTLDERVYERDRSPSPKTVSRCKQGGAIGSKRPVKPTARLDGWIFAESSNELVILTYKSKRVVRVPTSIVAEREVCEARPNFYLRSVYNLKRPGDPYRRCRGEEPQ